MIKVSILVAARNEADNILGCLRSIEALSYPKENLQILIGNDASEDNTAALVRDFIAEKPHFQLVDIAFQLSESSPLKGKTNVLAQLAQLAIGEYLFFTDADIEVPTDWVQNMIVHFKPNVGVVTGITTMQPSSLLSFFQKRDLLKNGFIGFQALEWLYYLSIVRLFSLFNIPITAMGNNMAVTRKAYDTTGGYENIPFSITEDYALFHAILNKGFRFVQLFDRRVLTVSKPIPSFNELLIQRKRWMYGAISLPRAQRIGIYLNALLLPCLVVLAYFLPKTTLFIVFIHYVSIIAWLAGILNWLQRPQLFFYIPFFWFYHILINFIMLINFYTKKKTMWKGRSY